MTIARYSLSHLSDDQLLKGLARLNHESQELTAELLAHLAEVDARRLYLTHACSSLFNYCLERLGCTEDEAGRRIHAARVARRFPVIFEMVASGELHLSTVNLLAPYLEERSGEELLFAARHKTKRGVEELLAARFPRADAPSILRRLAAPKAMAPSSSMAMSPQVAAQVGAGLRPPVSGAPGAPQGITSTAFASAGVAAAAPDSLESAPMPIQLSGESCRAVPLQPRGDSARAVLAPLSAERFKLQVTLSREGRDKLLRAQALLRHKIPSGDLSAVLERALTILCAELEARKFGKRKQKSNLSGEKLGRGRQARDAQLNAGQAGKCVRESVGHRKRLAPDGIATPARAGKGAVADVSGSARGLDEPVLDELTQQSRDPASRNPAEHVLGRTPVASAPVDEQVLAGRPFSWATGEGRGPKSSASPAAASAEYVPGRTPVARAPVDEQVLAGRPFSCPTGEGRGPKSSPLPGAASAEYVLGRTTSAAKRGPAEARSPASMRGASNAESGSPGAERRATPAADKRSRYIPRTIRREVAERDEHRCAYVDARGQRCRETAWLELHHRTPFARGGKSTVDGLELRCRMHNDLQARLDFGEAHMSVVKTRLHEKAARSSPPIRRTS
jgi:hypothetical protein